MFNYALNKLDVTKFTAKISTKNHPSLNLFTNKFGFVRTGYSEAFQEISLEWVVNNDVRNFLEKMLKDKGGVKETVYDLTN